MKLKKTFFFRNNLGFGVKSNKNAVALFSFCQLALCLLSAIATSTQFLLRFVEYLNKYCILHPL